MIRELSKVYKIEKLSPDIYSMWLVSPVIAKRARPGQFVQVQISDSIDPFLCRPLSIANVNKNKLRIIFRIIGKGTELLKDKKVDDSVYLLGPLGNQAELAKNKNVILCAGGVGIAPLLFLAKQLSKNNQLFLCFGAKNKKELILLDEFKQLCETIFLTTEDGSKGTKGFVTDLLLAKLIPSPRPPILYAAGPFGMLKKIRSIVTNIKIYGFLEERMGCGCGICFGCGVKKKDDGYLRVCTDGPVFDLSEIEL